MSKLNELLSPFKPGDLVIYKKNNINELAVILSIQYDGCLIIKTLANDNIFYVSESDIEAQS